MCDNKDVLSKEEVETLVSEIVASEGVEDGELVISSGSSKGDGFMSYMTRVDILGKNKTLNLIIKCAPKNVQLRKIATVDMIYNREIKFYSEIYPAIKKFQEERNVEKPFKSIAKCYKTDLTDCKELLIFDNIRKTGFDLWDKTLPMDENHVKLLLEVYAKLHATSYAIQEQQPKIFEELVKDFPSLLSPEFIGHEFFDSITMCFEKLQRIFQGEEEICGKLQNLKEHIIDYFLYVKDCSKFPTVVHGDGWCNNMMFKYEDPTNKLNPTEVCLLDFQNCSLGSPILDISNFLYSNCAKENLKKLDKYLDIYYEHLSSHFYNLGCKTNLISKEDLKSEWALFSKYGYMLSLIVIRSSLIEPQEAMDFSEILESGKTISDLYFRDLKHDDLMDERYQDLTRHMFENGFLDFEI